MRCRRNTKMVGEKCIECSSNTGKFLL